MKHQKNDNVDENKSRQFHLFFAIEHKRLATKRLVTYETNYFLEKKFTNKVSNICSLFSNWLSASKFSK